MSSVAMRVDSPAPGDSEIIAEILRMFDSGADVLFSRSHTGEAKIKVKYGPFKLRTARYTVNDKTAVAIKDSMRARIKK
jgi:hypothetical protein